MNATSRPFDVNPTIWRTGLPPTNTSSVGTDITPYRPWVTGLASTSTVITRSSLDRSFATSSSTGASIRHGGHQAAPNSTRTGVSDASTSASKVASSTGGIMWVLLIAGGG